MRAPRRALLLAIALAGLALPLSGGRASTLVRQLSPAELGRGASVVARGEVTGVRSFWNAKHTKILTEVSVRTEETYKGTADGTLRILQLGGTVDNVRVTVHGAVAWTPGEEVLLFLEPAPDDALQVSGLSQGKFLVVRDPRSGEPLVTRQALQGLELTGETTGEATAPMDGVPLKRFLDEALGEGRTPRR